jgi:hypothetical protein
MRTKERPQNVGEVYSSGRKELPAREAGLVYPPESALPSWGCDRGWRASATLRSRSTQEMDGGENKVDEMKVARPPVLAGPTTGHYLLLLIDGQPAGAVPWSAAPAARQQSSTKRRTVQAAPTRGVDLRLLATFIAPIRRLNRQTDGRAPPSATRVGRLGMGPRQRCARASVRLMIG